MISWLELKDKVYGIKGTERRDKLEKDSKDFINKLSLTQQLDSVKDPVDLSHQCGEN